MSKNPKNVGIILDLLPGIEAPHAATGGSAGIDLRANIDAPVAISPQAPAVLIPTGIRLDMSDHPEMCAVILPRSGLGHERGLVLGNGTGLIDSDYQGEVFVSAWNRNPPSFKIGMGAYTNGPIVIEPGERIAQLVFLPVLTPDVVFHTVESFDATERGAGGFGSTGVA